MAHASMTHGGALASFQHDILPEPARSYKDDMTAITQKPDIALDRPWGGSAPPMVAYVYAADRKTERPEAHLSGFAGILQVDGYGAYTALARRHQRIRLAFCWAHVRRKFYELAESSPVAADVLRRIASLYAIEEEIRGLSADERRAVRNQRTGSKTLRR